MNRRGGLRDGHARIDASRVSDLPAVWENFEYTYLHDPICLDILARRFEVDDDKWPINNQVFEHRGKTSSVS